MHSSATYAERLQRLRIVCIAARRGTMVLVLKASGVPALPRPGSTYARLRSADEATSAQARAELLAMSAEVLLHEARAVGLTVTATAAGALRVRGPEGTEELARLVLGRKEEVLPLLGPPAAVTPGDFGAELARLLARLDRVEAAGGPQLTRPRRNVLAVIRQQLQDYAAQRSAALWDCEAWLSCVLRDRWGIQER
jgi:hypothetical protein